MNCSWVQADGLEARTTRLYTRGLLGALGRRDLASQADTCAGGQLGDLVQGVGAFRAVPPPDAVDGPEQEPGQHQLVTSFERAGRDPVADQLGPLVLDVAHECPGA